MNVVTPRGRLADRNLACGTHQGQWQPPRKQAGHTTVLIDHRNRKNSCNAGAIHKGHSSEVVNAALLPVGGEIRRERNIQEAWLNSRSASKPQSAEPASMSAPLFEVVA